MAVGDAQVHVNRVSNSQPPGHESDMLPLSHAGRVLFPTVSTFGCIKLDLNGNLKGFNTLVYRLLFTSRYNLHL